MIVGFAPRKEAIALYLAGGFAPLEGELSKLRKQCMGKGSLYIKTLSDSELQILKKILTKSYKSLK